MVCLKKNIRQFQSWYSSMQTVEILKEYNTSEHS